MNRDWVAHSFELTRRWLVTLATALWFGGFTFYSLVVIHIGHRVFGNHRDIGFLTQRVTHWLNLIGAAALSILLWNAVVAARSATRLLRRGLALTWCVMAAVEVALFCLHPQLDRLLDTEAHRILDPARFDGLHLLYLNLSTGQWLANFLHIGFILAAWMRADRLPPTRG